MLALLAASLSFDLASLFLLAAVIVFIVVAVTWSTRPWLLAVGLALFAGAFLYSSVVR